MATRTKRKRGYVDPHIFITDVDSLTLRDFDGAGRQAELLIRTRTGALYVRLIGRKGVKPRFTDMRATDRRRAKRTFIQGVEARSIVQDDRMACAAEAAADAREDR